MKMHEFAMNAFQQKQTKKYMKCVLNKRNTTINVCFMKSQSNDSQIECEEI